MFEVGWTEMLVIAIVMIVVVGPKDLPRMLRQFGRTTAKLRGMAGDFRKQFDEALKEADLDDVKNSVESLRGLNPADQIRKHINPFEKAAADVRAGIDQAMKPKVSTAGEPASPVAHVAEPLKTGPTEMPGAAPPMAPLVEVAPAVAAKAAPKPKATRAPPVKAEAPAKAAKPVAKAEKPTAKVTPAPAKTAPPKAVADAPTKAAPAKSVASAANKTAPKKTKPTGTTS